MKAIKGNNYGSIPHLSNSKLGIGDYHIHEGQERILTQKKRDKHDLILAFEKYDGSNVGIAKVNGQILALTRSGYLAKTSPYLQHHAFSDWVEKNAHIFFGLLIEGERIIGEWIYQVHSLHYKIKNAPIVFFDLFDRDNKRYNYSDFLIITEDYDIEIARLLHMGDSISVESLLPILNQRTPTIESVEQPEGIVFRCERNGKVDFLAKWVRPDFEAGKYCVGVEPDKLIYNKTLEQ